MDFDPNLASTSAQVALYAMQSQQSHHAAGAAPPGSSRQMAPKNAYTLKESMTCATENQVKEPANDSTIIRKNRPTTYHDLPPDIIQQIAAYIPFHLIGDLSAVDRRTYHVLRERRLSYLCHTRASYTNARTLDLTSALQLLADIERIRSNTALRAEPLMRLALQISNLPDEQKPTAFSLIFETADRMPKKQRLQVQKQMIEDISDYPARNNSKCTILRMQLPNAEAESRTILGPNLHRC
ncbi:hypothetical protein KQH60_00960 [Mycetohabitans sp. B8]|uniref:hypothetical protein n=1 Tax=Mycetohabitans sp. B8 TaxID=2841845 RepID=UPI001F3B8BB9|nr:hypothetical protein [Mycetohabitans sp. B8]MCG1041211.1 hypothetical protein [Mycetohabitans sp. B8]